MSNIRMPKSRIVEAVCRANFVSFFRKCFHTLMPNASLLMNWHIYAMAYALEQVWLGKTRRLIINVPPRSLKSTMMVALAAFILGLDPTMRIIVVTYGADLSIKFTNDLRAILNAAWYRRLFPKTCISRIKNTEVEVQTTENGFFLATSIDGSLTGRGGDFVFIDDPLKPMDALSDSKRERVNVWFSSTLLSRLDDKQTGRIVLFMQRLHSDDLAGRLQRPPSDWTTLALSASCVRPERIQIGENTYYERRVGEVLHAEREPLYVLEQIRSQIGTEMFAAQYQQSPMRPDSLVMQSWIQRYDQLPTRTSDSKVIQSWDTASKDGELNDYSVCVTLLYHGAKYYLVDVLRERLLYPQLRERAIAHARAHQANTILIEDAGAGIHLVTELKNAKLPAVAVKPQLNKKMRMAVQLEKFKSGTILLPKQASWLANFEDELFAFPHSRYDDQVDALSQALAEPEPGSYVWWTDKHTENFNNMLASIAFENFIRRFT